MARGMHIDEINQLKLSIVFQISQLQWYPIVIIYQLWSSSIQCSSNLVALLFATRVSSLLPSNGLSKRMLTQLISRRHYGCPLWTGGTVSRSESWIFEAFDSRYGNAREPFRAIRRINSGGASSMTVPVLMRFNKGFLSYFQLLFTISSGHSIYRSLRAILPPSRP